MTLGVFLPSRPLEHIPHEAYKVKICHLELLTNISSKGCFFSKIIGTLHDFSFDHPTETKSRQLLYDVGQSNKGCLFFYTS